MKKIFFYLIIFVFANTNLFAQKILTGEKRLKAISAAPVVYLDDTIYSKAKPYCLMKQIKVNEYHPDCSIKNMRGEELIYIKWDTKSTLMGAYVLTFKKDGKGVKLSVTDEEKFPELIVNNDLFVNNDVPDDREKNFISNNGGGITNTTSTTESKPTTKSNSEIYVADKLITQDLMKIGEWKLVKSYYQDKVLWHETEWYKKDGTKVAQAKYKLDDADQAMVLTYSDNKTTQLSVAPSQSVKKIIATYLRENEYL